MKRLIKITMPRETYNDYTRHAKFGIWFLKIIGALELDIYEKENEDSLGY